MDPLYNKHIGAANVASSLVGSLPVAGVFAATLAIGVLQGLLIGIAASCMLGVGKKR